MFVTIRKYKGCTDVEELNKVVKIELVPAIEKVEGFHSYAAVDCGGQTVASIGMFDSKEAAERANSVARQIVQQSMSKLLPNPPEITVGYVVT